MQWLRHLGAGGLLLSVLCGCVTEENAAPSAALFPGGDCVPSSATQSSTPPAGPPTSAPGSGGGASAAAAVPGNLAAAGTASRVDTEIQTLYGDSQNRDKKKLQSLREAIESGYFEDKNTGKRLYRIQTLYQAQQILQRVWSADHWNANSELTRRFKEVPNASVTIVGEKDQRILFFDQSGRLLSAYSQSG